jgi:dTMP kinase
MRAKIICIEGTDCSGKETQSKELYNKLVSEGYKVDSFSFPNYKSPTGKIVGGPYLGKPEICEGFFDEKAPNVDPIVASLYYAADRRYNFLKEIMDSINENEIVILDRYVGSNLGHQGSKIVNEELKDKFFDILYQLEFVLCELPEPDVTLFLHMPYEAAVLLKQNRASLDQHEKDPQHLLKAEQTYLRLCEKFGWKYINCIDGKFIDKTSIKSEAAIAEEVYDFIENELKNNPEAQKLTMTLYN